MSFRPSKQVEGGAVEFDGTIVSAKIAPFTYQSGQETLGLILQIRDDDAGTLRKYTDNYSIGSLTVYGATENGLGVVNVKEQYKDQPAQITSKSRAGEFFAAVVASGMNEDAMQYEGDENNVKFLEGARFHFALSEKETKEGGKSKLILPTKYLGTGTAAPSAGATTAAANADFDEAVKAAILELVAANDGKLAKSKLTIEVPKKFGADKKSAIIKNVLNDTFLKSIDGLTYDGKQLSL